MGGKKVSIYKGDYKPVTLQKNAKKLSGFSVSGTNKNEAIFEGTYNDSLTLYGKSEFLKSPNLCPNLKAQSGAINPYSWQITPNIDGTFNFSGAMVTGETVGRVKLPAGTYTASGCKLLQLYWDGIDGFLTLPATFTLSKETTVLLVLWYTETVQISLENQYIQIEEGSSQSAFLPYAGNAEMPPSPQNVLKPVSASGTVLSEPGNLLPPEFLDFENWAPSNSTTIPDSKIFNISIAEDEYVFSFDTQLTSNGGYLYIQESKDGWETSSTIIRPLMGDAVSKSVTFTVKRGYEYRFWHWSLDEKAKYYSNWQLRRSDTPSGIYPYFAPVMANIPTLCGIEVDENAPYNYEESENGSKTYYISDVLKGDKIIRNVGNLTFSGDEQIFKLEEKQGLSCYYIDLSTLFELSKNSEYGFCNCLKRLENFDFNEEGFLLGNNDKRLYLFLNSESFGSVESVKTWLAELKSSLSPFTLYYRLEQSAITSNNDTPFPTALPRFTRLSFSLPSNIPEIGKSACIKVEK